MEASNMMRIVQLLRGLWLPTLLSIGIASAAEPSERISSKLIFESTSSGLIQFSRRDRAIRVAVAFAKQDDAVVETLVNFVDENGTVIKQQRGDLRDRSPVVAELTRQDVGEQTELLVRVEVVHKLPGVRRQPYPILVTMQPISHGGFGRFVIDWGGGDCGCPTCGPPIGPGQHAECTSSLPIGF
jgi:hypothetical protein